MPSATTGAIAAMQIAQALLRQPPPHETPGSSWRSVLPKTDQDRIGAIVSGRGLRKFCAVHSSLLTFIADDGPGKVRVTHGASIDKLAAAFIRGQTDGPRSESKSGAYEAVVTRTPGDGARSAAATAAPTTAAPTTTVTAMTVRSRRPGPSEGFVHFSAEAGTRGNPIHVTAADWRVHADDALRRGVPGMDGLGDSDGEVKERSAREMRQFMDVMPASVRALVERLEEPLRKGIFEVVLDEGDPAEVYALTGDGHRVHYSADASDPVTLEDLRMLTDKLGAFGSDNRAGLGSTLHRFSAMRDREGGVVGITARVGNAIPGCLYGMQDIVLSDKNVLLLGAPGMGKTTMLREFSRLMACPSGMDRRVVVIDTSQEIAGCGARRHQSIAPARRMHVTERSRQHKTMIEAVQNHTPDTIVIDEIANREEAAAAQSIGQRGVRLIATAHGDELCDLIRNRSLQLLIGGCHDVILSGRDAEARGSSQRTVLERQGPPVFDVCVELHGRAEVVIHHDVASAIDELLRERRPEAERRTWHHDYADADAGEGAHAAVSVGGGGASSITETSLRPTTIDSLLGAGGAPADLSASCRPLAPATRSDVPPPVRFAFVEANNSLIKRDDRFVSSSSGDA